MTVQVQGLNEAIAALSELWDEEQAQEIGHAVAMRLLPVVQELTPVDTGAMQGAWVVDGSSIIIDLNARNPRTGARVIDYAPYVDLRLGITDALATRAGAVIERVATDYGY
jgi:hypothetical protein